VCVELNLAARTGYGAGRRRILIVAAAAAEGGIGFRNPSGPNPDLQRRIPCACIAA
jgi:hypothetical protein